MVFWCREYKMKYSRQRAHPHWNFCDCPTGRHTPLAKSNTQLRVPLEFLRTIFTSWTVGCFTDALHCCRMITDVITTVMITMITEAEMPDALWFLPIYSTLLALISALFSQHTHRKNTRAEILCCCFLPNSTKNLRFDNFPFVFEPNGIPVGSETKGNI